MFYPLLVPEWHYYSPSHNYFPAEGVSFHWNSVNILKTLCQGQGCCAESKWTWQQNRLCSELQKKGDIAHPHQFCYLYAGVNSGQLSISKCCTDLQTQGIPNGSAWAVQWWALRSHLAFLNAPKRPWWRATCPECRHWADHRAMQQKC